MGYYTHVHRTTDDSRLVRNRLSRVQFMSDHRLNIRRKGWLFEEHPMRQEYSELGWMMVYLYSYGAQYIEFCIRRNALKTLTHMGTADGERRWLHGVFQGVGRQQLDRRRGRDFLGTLGDLVARCTKRFGLTKDGIFELSHLPNQLPIQPSKSDPRQGSTSVYSPDFTISAFTFTNRDSSLQSFHFEPARNRV